MPDLPGQAEAEARYGNKPPPQIAAQIAAAEALISGHNAPPPVTDGGTPAAEGSPPPAPGQPASPAPATSPAGDPWEQRARSAEGRVSTLAQQLQAQAERASQLERLVATMEAQGQSPQPEGQTPAPFQRLITPEEENDYGVDLISVTKRAAREELAPEVETLAQRLERLEGRVNGVGTVIAQNETRTVWQMLNEGVGPHWNEINHHPAFHAWLDQSDLYSGDSRRALLMDAFDRHDGRRVLNIFQGFLREANGTPQTAQPHSDPSPANGNGYGKVPLETFAAPGRARSEPQPLAPEKPIYSRAQIERFYGDRRKGMWRGREADADALEADIFRAQHEGRIR